ncbi:MAG: hypothetical protein V9E87_00265 [Gemmatimonadales bacterium]
MLDPDFKRFHTEPPDSTPKQVRLPIRVDQAPFVDVLTWSMPELSDQRRHAGDAVGDDAGEHDRSV